MTRWMACALVLLATYTARADTGDILDLGLEELLNIQVSSVSKKQQSLQSVASAVYVISNSDLRRSGVTNIPDALRMVPGVQVARITSNNWAVTSRGFNGRYANKLLVMIDGRTVYSPTYSGVNWYMQNVRLEDIERIEVVRGPGGSVWGANAVNGVINIITKSAADTRGGEIVAGAGDNEKAILNGRWGTKFGDNTYARAFLNANQRNDSIKPDGGAGNDAWENFRLGTRIDRYIGEDDTLAITADYSEGNLDQEVVHAAFTPPYRFTDNSGVDYSTWHVLGRWEHSLAAENNWSLQVYFDRLDSREFALDESRDTYDIDFTHRFQWGTYHDFMWGAGYRVMDDRILSSDVITINPESRRIELLSAFVQDQIPINDDLSFTLGAKWEHSDYSGNELQPSAKVSWKVAQHTQLWGSIAKAVRTSTIIDVDADILGLVLPNECGVPTPECLATEGLPLAIQVVASEDIPSEEVVAYELGVRSAISRGVSLDLAVFYNDYSNLRSFSLGGLEYRTEPVPNLLIPIGFAGTLHGKSQGVELASTWAPDTRLSVELAYTYFNSNIDWDSSVDVQQNTPAPRHQLSARAHYQWRPDIGLNVWLRYVEETNVTTTSEDTFQQIDEYAELDINLAWQVSPTVELQLVGQNLLDSSHPEYIDFFLLGPSEVERGFYGKITVRF